MGIVRFALRFPHTFYVLAALIVFLGVTAIRTMPTDIFPQINIPVVTIIWSYTGLSTPEMEQRVSTYSQYSISSNVNGIKDMESQTLNGISVQKIYFQPDVNLDLAIAQIVSATNAIRALMPPGIQPPIIVQFNASSVPVLQLTLTSNNLNEQQLYDYGIYRLRQQLAPVPGVTFPTPAGGKYRQIMVDIDPNKLLARGLTPLDVVNAVNAQNLTLPSGQVKFSVPLSVEKAMMVFPSSLLFFTYVMTEPTMSSSCAIPASSTLQLFSEFRIFSYLSDRCVVTCMRVGFSHRKKGLLSALALSTNLRALLSISSSIVFIRSG